MLYLQLFHREYLNMKLPIVFPLLIFSFTSCITPPESDHDHDHDGYYEIEAPTVAINDLRNPGVSTTVGGGRKAFKIYNISYDLTNPDRVFAMPEKLNKIEGLSISPDGYSLILANHKDGEIHYINKWRGDYEKSVRYRKRARYRGIEAVQDDVFSIRENGVIVHASELHTDKPQSRVINTKLNAKYVVGGLAYYPKHNELLIACQGNDGDEAFDDSRGIYIFDINRDELMFPPMFLVNDEEILDYINSAHALKDAGHYHFHEPIRSVRFLPSAIAVHPQTDEIYVLSAANLLVAILSEEGKLLHVEELDPVLFREPSGMCIDVNGDLFISSKGAQGESGEILRFSKGAKNRYPS